MPGPGEYRPDPSQGITRIEACPSPRSAARAEITVVDPVHVAARAPIAIGGCDAPSTTWAIP